MLPDEFFLALEGYQEGQKRQDELAAWMISWLIAPHVKDPPSIDDILGRTAEAEDEEDETAKLERIWAKVEEQRAAKQTTGQEPG